VSPAELWLKVGKLLREARERRGWRYPFDVEKHGGPVGATVQNHEIGDIRTVDALNRHAEALGLALVDLLRAALSEAQKPISPEAERVLRTFERTTVQGRQALLTMAQALDVKEGVVPPEEPTP